jgi:hypothetical protein
MPVTTSTEAISQLPSAVRSKAPVFVLGSPRSGTTVLYHMLLSAGGFAVYRAESNVYNILAPRFGGLKSRASYERLLPVWLNSKLFRVSGLESGVIQRGASACRTPGDFLQFFMGQVAHAQGANRWADCTPDHLLHLEQIKREIPDALIIHIVRDGRDVALSFAQQGWSHPLPWDREQLLNVAGLYWSWIVGQGKKCSGLLGSDYLEVHYEDLVSQPQKVLDKISAFISQELDYERIKSVGIGSVSSPNSSFGSENGGSFNPVGRWKSKLSAAQLQTLEALIGDRLQELGYPLSSPNVERPLYTRYLRAVYPRLFSAKLWAKNHTPLGRLSDIGPMEVS